MIEHIIWISDIHLKEFTEDRSTPSEELIFEFAETFKHYVSRLIPETQSKIYIIITGDIAFSAEFNQYRSFKELLVEIFPKEWDSKIRLIITSGNHDCNWGAWISKYHNNSELTSFFSDRGKTYDSHNLTGLFENYYNNLSPDNFSKSNLGSDDDIYISEEYKKFGVQGFVLDKSNKLIFCILNTSWFSRGKSLETFLTNFGTIPRDKQLELIELSSESGKLITGFNSTKNKNFRTEVLDIFSNSKYSDYVKITLMHHPLDWLNPEEIHSYYPNKKNEGTSLTKLLKNSSLLLTGHVHPSSVNRREYLLDLELPHFRAPMLLNHYSIDQDNVSKIFPCNGFAEIKINQNSRKFTTQYHDIEFCAISRFSISPSGAESTPINYLKKSIDSFDDINNEATNKNKPHYEEVVSENNFNITGFQDSYKPYEGESIFKKTTFFDMYKISRGNEVKYLLVIKSISELNNLINNINSPSLMSEFINTVTEKNSEVLICFSGWSLQSISNEYDFEYIAKEDLRLQKIADSYLYEIRVSLFNYLEERIGSDEIKLQFSIWENVKFNVKILKSEWFQ